METIIRDLEPNYELISYRKKKDLIVFEIASKSKEAKCPYCGSISKRFPEKEIRYYLRRF